MCRMQNEKCLCPGLAGVALLGGSRQSRGSPDLPRLAWRWHRPGEEAEKSRSSPER